MNIYLAELIGTGLLILLGSGVVANMLLSKTKGYGGGIMEISTAWALAVFVGVVVAGPYSGAHLNPAVTLGLALTGQFDWALAPGYIIAQVLGAMIGVGIAWLFYKDHYDATDDAGLKAAPFGTSPAIRNLPLNFFSEVIGTFVLLLVILYNDGVEIGDMDSTPIGMGSLGAIPVAFLVWVIGLSLGGTTGYAINPARDFGPRLMHAILPIKGKGSSDWGYAWVPILGPCVGAALAAGLFLVAGS
ncbi:MIP/aquaporin family protein [Algoriphagus aquimarinus]|uniref:Glycerol uptake facilitator protein n=1 Tax=Algoriphagus aquimarinus TaxID=237018 RepID=A0A1I0V5F0_9BACT|nr:MIP/aquaporin family protein [Algoriphagus aquimarinus]SFA71579.1 glycerol uptake facilitator protein [Algoriphagus aquimarinus]|tara:strand:+ start:232310 stop:233044 length:735 start_codon:yes stop_codon:yes gene_type:complete